MLKINEVCKRYGITSRTLRHWESEGVIVGVRSTPHAARMYEDCELEKVEKILFLKKLNLPLKAIRDILSDPSSASRVLQAHRAYLGTQITAANEQVRLVVTAYFSQH